MTPDQIARVLPRLEEFAAEVFADLARVDQKGKATLYLRGLMTDGKRKSMQPMAERLGIDHQRLQQFITSSSWDYARVRRALALRMFDEIKPVAYAVDDVGFPKDGSMSPAVAPQYSGALGKVGNCQIGVSVQLVTDHTSMAANWRLFLPESWDDHVKPRSATEQEAQDLAAGTRLRRERTGIPDAVRHRTKPQLALDQLEQMTGPGGWDLPRLPVVADCAYGENTAFRLALTERGLSYALAVSADLSVQPGDAEPVDTCPGTRGPWPKPHYPDKPMSVKALAIQAGREAFTEVTWRTGSHPTPANRTAAMTGRFLALPVRPVNKAIPRGPDGALPAEVLLVQWDQDAEEPTDYWLTTLPPDTDLADLVHLAKIRWRIEHDYRELKDGLGLDHFEGRSYTGWHRHVTLATADQAFCTLLRRDPKVPAPA
ncbi:IS701 family transposase [Actinospica robiniae]|uniref:IS701 family transposase n=1 Tax=Actinospica robiniae TaxID=304901 RepID=UPI000551274B|nr:IS701 family transposase [Actinospica robiniae]